MEQDHHQGVTRGEAEWGVADPGQVPAVTVFVPVVEKRYLINRENRAII